MSRGCDICGIGGSANPLQEGPDAYGILKTMCGGCTAKQELKRAEIKKAPPQFCHSCRSPLAPANYARVRGSVGVCYACKEMANSILSRPGLMQAQRDWELEQQRKRQMLGGD